MKDAYDLVIIGGGAAGLMLPHLQCSLARVASIGKDRIGCDCAWTGCVPSKTLIETARVAYQMRTASRLGLAPNSRDTIRIRPATNRYYIPRIPQEKT